MNPQDIRLWRVLILIVRHAQRAGHQGAGNIGIHNQQEQRYFCHECGKTFAATKLLPAAH